WMDRLMMRGAELFLALPWLYLLLAVRAFLPLPISPVTAFLLMVTLIGTVGWGRPARLFRGLGFRLEGRPVLEGGEGIGGGAFRLDPASYPAGNPWAPASPGDGAVPAVHPGGGDAFVPGLGSRRTRAELGEHAG